MTCFLTEVEQTMQRRGFLKAGLTLSTAAILSATLVKPSFAMTGSGTYSAYFHNEHTGEVFCGVYRVGNKYLPEAFERINYVLRDFRENKIFPIDPRTIDIITTVQRSTGSNTPYSVLSGYRTAKTNAMLNETGGGKASGVAKHSLHMAGQAIDVRMSGVSTTHIRDVARQLHAGGVGYYPRSNFVHMDSGAPRNWG